MHETDSLAVCHGCLHELHRHSTPDGCQARDDLGNRCACEQAP